jgi:hypothetical protein
LFEPTWPFYLKLNLSKTIYFLKGTWFLYVLSKYQGMLKILQWNASLRKTPTFKIARSSPQKFSIYRSCIKSSIEVLTNTTKSIKVELKIIPIYLTSIINLNFSIPFRTFHNTTKWKELFSLKGTTFVYVLSSDWWISGLTPLCFVYISTTTCYYNSSIQV